MKPHLRERGKASSGAIVMQHVLGAILKIDSGGIVRQNQELDPADLVASIRCQERIRGKADLVFPVVCRRPSGRVEPVIPRELRRPLLAICFVAFKRPIGWSSGRDPLLV